MITDALFDTMIEDAEEYAIVTPDLNQAITIGGKLITREVLRKMDPNKVAFTSGLDDPEGGKGKLCIIGVGYTIRELKIFLDIGRFEVGKKIEDHIKAEELSRKN